MHRNKYISSSFFASARILRSVCFWIKTDRYSSNMSQMRHPMSICSSVSTDISIFYPYTNETNDVSSVITCDSSVFDSVSFLLSCAESMVWMETSWFWSKEKSFLYPDHGFGTAVSAFETTDIARLSICCPSIFLFLFKSRLSLVFADEKKLEEIYFFLCI